MMAAERKERNDQHGLSVFSGRGSAGIVGEP